ncbi:hypothetical protein AYO21_06497 [Fonsecaea monophora]|uniref:Uncharacterized protein n=1 Tax=Fonsecaea monophora TaxID=254056 RepID=A0A177F4W2_9EURO|nr:hypothetical protein AYO21_06497 [Fonsecaea monophora]KAH0830969.1 Bacilysin biosynthesis oxidoreductase [Fonsecaea pedrosoi]OAG39293.1 hypothetical protein AYO21_06497 [Fonsecaea monophora]
MNISLKSKSSIVTGAAGGFGKAATKALLLAGTSVVACDVNDSMLEECYRELSPLGNLQRFSCDLTDPNAAKQLVQKAVDAHGGLDILVNNAGIMDRFDSIVDVDMDFWDRVIATNLTAPSRLSKCAVQEFLRGDETQNAEGAKSSRGIIVNVGSINGFRGGLSGVAYTTAKHGLVGLTRNTAAFYSNKGIRCNIIMPGVMKTNIQSAYKFGVNEEARNLSRKLAEVNPGAVELDKLAKMVVWACSDDADYLSGAIISADYGWQAM